MNFEQGFAARIQEARKARAGQRMQDALALAREKAEAERTLAEISLIQDTLRAEGVNPESPFGILLCYHEMTRRQKLIAREGGDHADDFTRGLV